MSGTETGDETGPPRVAMLGGTFDPIHLGHLRAAVELGEVLALDRLHLIPSHLPPHREAPGVASSDRLAMVAAGIGDTPGLTADDREMRRDGPSWSLQTLESLRIEYGEQARLIMVLGLDAFRLLPEWHAPAALFDQAHIVVIGRPEHQRPDDPALEALIRGREVSDIPSLMAHAHGRMMYLELPTAMAISATEIRRRLAVGTSVRYLLPAGVERYIRDHQLYGPDSQ
ncbi:nicotinate-nucleotide adenylyltransferase [Kushneria sinocarnis]|uniref:Probable nicotinate-nucleotide adenylyltransferase n=1 Tax=Kushneria sinocarnis TaxID=595502 RepID=A0A420WYV1_9GAMM|nr:nicotinate-nucleotide adenylyltransferase [Kushneria sinocarnis]RKR06412.1 nicotinate-nucleotide adenylyltransferase [Kushneria sinocarnis]